MDADGGCGRVEGVGGGEVGCYVEGGGAGAVTARDVVVVGKVVARGSVGFGEEAEAEEGVDEEDEGEEEGEDEGDVEA